MSWGSGSSVNPFSGVWISSLLHGLALQSILKQIQILTQRVEPMGTLAVLHGTQPAPLTLSSVASLCNAQKDCFAAIFGYSVGRKISPEPKALGARPSCGVAGCKTGSRCSVQGQDKWCMRGQASHSVVWSPVLLRVLEATMLDRRRISTNYLAPTSTLAGGDEMIMAKDPQRNTITMHKEKSWRPQRGRKISMP